MLTNVRNEHYRTTRVLTCL